jgi:hypothetical protein
MHFADLLLILGLHEDHLARGKRKFVLTTALIPAFCPYARQQTAELIPVHFLEEKMSPVLFSQLE